MFIYRTDHIQ